MFKGRVGAQSTRVDINEIRRREQAAVDANVSAFGQTRHFKRDNRPKPEMSKEEIALKKKLKAQ